MLLSCELQGMTTRFKVFITHTVAEPGGRGGIVPPGAVARRDGAPITTRMAPPRRVVLVEK